MTRLAPAPARSAHALVQAARPTPAQLAWLAAVPCALGTLAAIVLLGPPLGRLLFHARTVAFWPRLVANHAVVPEPTEHARYLLALLGAAVLCAVVVLGRRRARLPATPTSSVLVHASQALLVAFVIACVAAQRIVTYSPPWYEPPGFHRVYFTWATIVIALVLAVALLAMLRRPATIERLAAATRETPRRRVAAAALAALLLAVWLMTAFNTDESINTAHKAVYVNIPFWSDETFAVLNGHAPLVDFHAQYSQLWPYLEAGVMSLLGSSSLGVYASVMILGSAATLLAVYALIRRITRRSLLALALYAPFVATSFFTEQGPPGNRYAPSNLFSLFPMRYGGPYLVAWLIARHLDGAVPRGRALLFVAAGLTLLNNAEFGAPALGAALAALIAAERNPSWARLARTLRDALLGLLGAATLVALLTLVVAGSLPHFGQLLMFSRLYGVDGFGSLPMPSLGLHLALFATFAAALVTGTARAVAREADVVLTGMLAWVGVFGLGIGSYFVGRSHPEALIALFSAWALALVLLAVVVVRAILRRPSRRPALAELLLLVACGSAVCSLAQTPTPWSQVARLQLTAHRSIFALNVRQRSLGHMTTRGESIATLIPLGHRMAYNVGVDDVAPYSNLESMPTKAQLVETIRALRAAHGRKLFMTLEGLKQEVVEVLQHAGLRYVREDPASGVIEMLDTRRAVG